MEAECYIGVKPCGHVAYIAADVSYARNDIADSIATLIKDGWKIEKGSFDEARSRFKICDCPSELTERR